MNKVKIWFDGMDGRFDMESNFISNAIKEDFDIVLDKDNPDFLFYSVKSKDYLKYNCVRIFFSAENIVPDFNICDYAIGFHYIDFEDRYFRYPIYLVDGFTAYSGDNYAEDLSRAMEKHKNVENNIMDKSDFCSFVYSNDVAVPCREKFFKTLSNYKRVNSGGRYLNNIGGLVEDKYDFQRKHKFVIAFENSSTSGYTTEKLVHAFSACAVPIYWGDPRVAEVFNERAFINCNKLGLDSLGNDEAIDRVVQEVMRIDNDDEVYKKMLEEPAFLIDYSPQNEIEKLKDFLIHILEQPREQAYRRNLFMWGERYERKQRIGNDFYQLCRKAIPIRDGIKKITHRD